MEEEKGKEETEGRNGGIYLAGPLTKSGYATGFVLLIVLV